MSEKPVYPPTSRMIKGLLREAVRYAKSGFKTRTQEEMEEVIAICEQCDFYVLVTRFGPRCSRCGCHMNIKRWWITSYCPKEKW